MKSLQILACFVAFLIPVALDAAPPNLQQLLVTGQAAYVKGDLPRAKMDFEGALHVDPNNATALGYLRLINDRENQGETLEKKLGTLVIPSLDFKGLPLGAALNSLKIAASRYSKGRINMSFIVQAPQAQMSQPLTLNLSNVSITTALASISRMTGLQFSFERYAVVVKSAGGTAPAANPTGALPPAR